MNLLTRQKQTHTENELMVTKEQVGRGLNREFEINIQFSSVAQSCPTLCNPMDCSMLDFSVHHQLQVLTQTHVYQVGDAIQPSHPLLPPSPLALSSQHQGLFQWVGSSHQVARILELQHQSFQWIFRGILGIVFKICVAKSVEWKIALLCSLE